MLDWITTIPGILIICGVILLVIAIILFIVGAKKSKKEEVSVSNQTIENNIPAVENVESSINVTPVAPVTPTIVEPVVPNVNATVQVEEVKTDIPVTEPIHIEEPVPVVNNMLNVEVPTYTNPVETSEPVVNIPEVNTQAEEINIPAPEATSTIYGGETPTVDFSTQEEKPVTIYGGNDPLEATQTLPKMEEHHEPYGGTYPEVKIVEPVVETPVPTPIEETVTEIPTIEPVMINEPEVVNIPVEEPVISEPVVVPVEAKETVVEEL